MMKSTVNSMMYFVLFLFLSFMTGASAIQVNKRLNSSEIDVSLLRLLRVVGETVYDPASNTTFQLIEANSTSNTTLKLASANFTFQYSEYGCTVYRQTKIAENGTWWSPWYKVSTCQYTKNNEDAADYELGYGYRSRWLIQDGPIGWKQMSPIIGNNWK